MIEYDWRGYTIDGDAGFEHAHLSSGKFLTFQIFEDLAVWATSSGSRADAPRRPARPGGVPGRIKMMCRRRVEDFLQDLGRCGIRR